MIFLFHSTGSGKTCSAVIIAEQYIKYMLNKKDRKWFVYIIGNISSHNEFKNTITDKYGNNKCSNMANNILYTKKNPYTTGARIIDDYYKFYSFQKFAYKSINNEIENFDNSLLIIDEVHSLLNDNKYYKGIKQILNKSKNYKMVIMTATPMINKADNIINFINIMSKSSDEIKKKDVFVNDGNGKISINTNLIINKLKGKVSYLSNYDPHYFPLRNDIGIIPKGLLKYTPIIQVPMSKIQQDAYNKYYNGKINFQIKHIINFVMPGFDDIDYIFGHNFNVIKYAPKKWLDKYEVVLEKKNRGREKLTGNFLLLKNLKKWSGKYHKVLYDILNNKEGQTLIYSRYVNFAGIKLFQEILYINGFENWATYNNGDLRPISLHYKTFEKYENWIKNDKNKDVQFIPAKFATIFNIYNNFERENIKNIFNSRENKYGKEIKIIMGSDLIKESIDLKRVQHIRIINYLENFSNKEQLIGRGIRYKSFDDIANKIVNIYTYVSSLRKSNTSYKYGKWSIEELEYKNDEQHHIEIKKIERSIKISSIDCNMNKDKYNKDYSKNCNYMKCKYKCLYDDIDFKNIYNTNNEFIYYFFFFNDIIFDISNIINRIFYYNIIVSIENLLKLLLNNLPNEKESKYIKNIILYVIKLYLIDKVKITNKYGIKGYLITDENNILFHPELLSDMKNPLLLSINNRGSVSNKIETYSENIDNILENIISLEIKSFNIKKDINKMVISDIILKLSSKLINFKKTKSIINGLSKINQIKLLEYVIINSKKKDKFNLNKKGIYNILKYFKLYLIDEKSLKKTKNILYNMNYDKFFGIYNETIVTFEIYKRKFNFIGHYYGNLIRIYNENKKKYINKTSLLNDNVVYKKKSKIMGQMTKDEKNNYNFKIIDKRKVFSKDIRKIKKGYICVNINDKKQLIEIYNILINENNSGSSSKIIKKKYKISNYCNDIQNLLIELQAKSIINGEMKHWYSEYIFQKIY
jgi:superfamily II DNA or RNA helicase